MLTAGLIPIATASGDYSSANLFGDAGSMSGTTHGGNHALSAINSGSYAHSAVYGDALAMSDSAQGGNDILTVINSGDHSYSSLYGDGQDLGFDNVRGGNDTLTAYNVGSGSHSDLFGDAYTLSGADHGGNDILTAIDTGDTQALLVGDAAYLAGTAQGGNDALDGHQLFGSLRSTAMPFTSTYSTQGGNDTLTSQQFQFETAHPLSCSAMPTRCPAMPRAGMIFSRPTILARASSYLYLFGDAGFGMHDRVQGGNDILTVNVFRLVR